MSDDTDRANEPFFSSKEASHFFDMNVFTFRSKDAQLEYVDKKGRRIRPSRTVGNARRFSINDLREMAHSLRRNNTINDYQLKVIVARLDAFLIPVEWKKSRKTIKRGIQY